MGKRQLTQTFRSWLDTELKDWKQREIVSGDQARQILELYESPQEYASQRRSTAVHALMGIAVALVGFAVLLLIGYNWQAMPSAAKLATIFGAVIVIHAAGFYMRYVRDAHRLSEMAFLLGCLCYGTGIWLVAQIFHVNVHFPDGLWWWAIGVLPFALCLETPLLHVLFVALLATWAGTEVLGYGDLEDWFFGLWRHVPHGAYTLPLLALPGLVWAYQRKSVVTAGLYAPLLAWWVILQPFCWEGSNVNPFYFIGSVGGIFALLAESHPTGSRMAIPFRLYGVLLVAGILTLMSFYDFNNDVLLTDFASQGVGPVLILVAISGIVVVVAAMRSHQRISAHSTLVKQLVTRAQWPPLLMILLMAGLCIQNSLITTARHAESAALLTTIGANAAMVGLALWLISVGLREDRGRPFAAGVMLFLFWSVLRYIDLFGDFGGMLGAALMFFVCGAALFGVALFWRRRKGASHA